MYELLAAMHNPGLQQQINFLIACCPAASKLSGNFLLQMQLRNALNFTFSLVHQN